MILVFKRRSVFNIIVESGLSIIAMLHYLKLDFMIIIALALAKTREREEDVN